MAKTVLQYVQDCLDIMDSDAVDSINDTEESLQVAGFLENVYFELLNREEWKFLRGPAQFTGAGDTSTPTLFTIGGAIKTISEDDCYVAYNVADAGDPEKYRELTWLEPVEFLKKFSVSGDNRDKVEIGSKVTFYVDNNKAPTYFTSFDDESIVCDAYDSSVESTLQTSKLNVVAYTIPSFLRLDTFEPDIPRSLEPLLQAELNSAAHLWMKQVQSSPDERRAARQLAQARRSHSKTTNKGGYYKNKFGRK